MSTSQKTSGMILAAGLGTRLKPWTDHHPKALAMVNGQSLLQRNVLYLQQAGITDVVVNVHHFAEQIKNVISENNGWGSNITIVQETDEPLETGGGLINAAPHLHGDNIVLMNVDILTDLSIADMMAYHQQYKPLATLATTNRATSRYFLFNENNRLCGWRNTQTGEEKKSAPLRGTEQQQAFSGIHIIDRSIFSLIKRTGKFSIVDVYLELMSDHTILSYDHSHSRFIDVGKPESVVKAETLFS